MSEIALPVRIETVSSLHYITASMLRELTEPILITAMRVPVAVLCPYELYLELQKKIFDLEAPRS